MALLLSIETTSHSFSCALHNDYLLINSKEISESQSTASKLAVTIEQLFSETGLSNSLLSGVIVASGPGSYTGLRIGASTAKGICYALDIPLISINSLELMAYQVSSMEKVTLGESDLLCPMLDARRMEVYCMIINHNLKPLTKTEAKVLADNSFQNELNRNTIYFFGDGSSKFKLIVQNENARFLDGIHPMASYLGRLGYEKFQVNSFEDIERFEPFYLKDFVIKKPNLIS